MKYKIIITSILFTFSLLYLKYAIYITKENDNLMKIIKEKQNEYNADAKNAIITKNTMIPGKTGKRINLNKTYKKMKRLNRFSESLLVFDKIKPSKSIEHIYDKVIISGRSDSNKISIILNDNQEYCFTTSLEINNDCIKNHKYTIHITKISNNHLNKVKELVKNGIVFNLEYSSIYNDLDLIKKYLKNNNYEIVDINKLIEE